MITKNYDGVLSSVCIDTGVPGPIVSIFSGVHGDEKSGVKANKKFLRDIEFGNISIKKGILILVLEANEEAVKNNKREIDYDLNRLFRDDIFFGNTYEEKRAGELKNLLKKSDYLLDLHSTSGPSIPFIFSEMQHINFAKKLGISHIIAGWGELGKGVILGDTETYINKLGGIGFTYEAGSHDNPEGGKNAYKVLLNFLSVLGVIDSNYYENLQQKSNYIKIVDIYIAMSNKFTYKIDIQNFSKIIKGTLIGLDNGEEVYAKDDMILIMPKNEKIIEKGVEVFFVGKKIFS